MIELPAFSLFRPGPKAPLRRMVIARHTNERGTVFTLFSNHPRTAWWIEASKAGMRMGTTIRTTSKAKAAAWERDVNAGDVRVAEASTAKDKAADERRDAAIAKRMARNTIRGRHGTW